MMINFFEYPLILEVIEETFGECLRKFWKKNGREFKTKKIKDTFAKWKKIP